MDSAEPSESMNKDSMLFKWFTAVLNNSRVDITEEELQKFLDTDLAIKPDEMDEGLKLIFPAIVSIYLRNWTGWEFFSDYKAGKFPMEHYFRRFLKYVTFKITRCIKRDYVNSLNDAERRQLRLVYNKKNQPNETINSSNNQESLKAGNKQVTEVAPYSILIKCPPQMVNTLVFSSEGDDVILKHHTGGIWRSLNTRQLIMWPHITVTFVTSDLYFTRSQVSEYQRYLNFFPQNCLITKDGPIDSIENVGPKLQREVYSYVLVECYVKEYIKKLRELPLPSDQMEEIEAVLTCLLEDIKAINQEDTIATNTKIVFKLSEIPFVRNKKLLQGANVDESARVGYCEVIFPKTELLVRHFKAEQLPTSQIKFKSTELIKKVENSTVPGLRGILPKIFYKCNFCYKDFVTVTARRDVLEHLSKEHKVEQPVRCTLCKKSFDVLNLTLYRWRHRCTVKTN